jgi:hypothetical protein
MLWKKGACPKTKGSGSSKKVAIQLNPIEFTVQDSGYLFFLCEAKIQTQTKNHK